MGAILEAKSLTKQYGSHRALHALNMDVGAGEVLCLLGPNGAGKSTTIHLLLGFIQPTSGQALVCGIDSAVDPLNARRELAYIPENVMLYGALSGLENLRYFGALATGERMGMDEAASYLQQAGLPTEAAARPVGTYSKGMRQKVGIAIALVRRARALLLDEPTSGLDPLAAGEFSRLIRGLSARGMAVLMVTHDLMLAQQCATRVGIMRAGRLLRILGQGQLDAATLEQACLETSLSATKAGA